jgi:diguanylate cyclase (GGDEF)-like protein/PAS domain S-box-containing protein
MNLTGDDQNEYWIREKSLETINRVLDKNNLSLLENLLNTLPMGITIQTLNGEVFWANLASAKMHGYSVEEITSNSFSSNNLVAPIDRERIQNAILRLYSGESVGNFRFSGLNKDGSEFPEEVKIGLLKDNHGNPFAFITINQNITRITAEEERQELALSDALIKSAELLSGTLHLDDVLERILELVGQVVPHDSANIMLIEGENARVVRARGYKTPELHDFTMSVKTRVQDFPSMVQMIHDGLPIMIQDTRKYSGWFTSDNFSWLLSYLGAPLRIKGKPIGVINLDSATPNFFKETDCKRLQAFADIAATAIENANLYETLEQQTNELASLFHASTALLNTSSDIAKMAEQIVQTVHRDFTTAHCAVLLVDSENSLLHRVAQAGYPTINNSPLAYNDIHGITVNVIKGKKPIYVPDVSVYPDYFTGSEDTCSEFDIPFIIEDEVIGILNMESSEIDGFNERARKVLIMYAERAASALENARLFNKLQKREHQITLFNRITQISLETSNLEEMLEHHANILLETFLSDGVVFTFSNQDLRKIVTGYAASFDRDLNQKLNELVSNSIFSIKLADFSNSEISEDTVHKNLKESQKHNPFKSYTLRKLDADGMHLGSVVIGYQNPHMFEPGEIDFFEQAANQIALAISKNLSLFIANERAREAESMREATSTLTSTLNLQEIFERILVSAATAIPSAQKGLLLIFDQEKREFIVRAQYGYDDPNVFTIRLKKHEGIAGKSVAEKKAVLFNDISAEKGQIFPHDNQEIASQNCWIVAPLLKQGSVFGVIELSAQNTDVFSDNDLKVLVSFADTVTAAIQNAQLHSEVQQIALTDALTGLYNRRGFVELGQREISRSIRTGAPLSMLFLDVDFLKQINDDYGHNAGDQVLQEVAECCRTTFRQIDLIARYGGDEYAILLPDTPLDHAKDAAERIRERISSHIFSIQGKKIKLSASVGVVKFNKVQINIDEFIDRADKALYSAKKKGRNAIAFWED